MLKGILKGLSLASFALAMVGCGMVGGQNSHEMGFEGENLHQELGANSATGDKDAEDSQADAGSVEASPPQEAVPPQVAETPTQIAPLQPGSKTQVSIAAGLNTSNLVHPIQGKEQVQAPSKSANAPSAEANQTKFEAGSQSAEAETEHLEDPPSPPAVVANTQVHYDLPYQEPEQEYEANYTISATYQPQQKPKQTIDAQLGASVQIDGQEKEGSRFSNISKYCETCF